MNKNTIWKYYKVLVEGLNFYFQVDAESIKRKKDSGIYIIKFARINGKGKVKIKRMGFYTTVFVRARNFKEAEYSAMRVLRRNRKLKDSVCIYKGDMPMMYAEEITQIKSFVGCKVPISGFGFFYDKNNKTNRRLTRHSS